MQDAQHNGKLIPASAASPSVAVCPDCGAEVRKRKRTDTGSTTWFYRHAIGAGPDDCPRRYRPVAER